MVIAVISASFAAVAAVTISLCSVCVGRLHQMMEILTTVHLEDTEQGKLEMTASPSAHQIWPVVSQIQ